MDVPDQYLDIQLCDKHLTYSVLISKYSVLISKIFILTYFNILLSKSESVKFSLIESVICLFTDSSVKKYFSLLNQLISTDSSVKKIFFTIKSVNLH